MTFHVLSLIALAVTLGTASKLLHRYVLKETEPYAYALLNNIIGTLFFLPLALKDFSLPNVGVPWITLAISSVLWSVLAVVKFVSYKKTEVSLRDPLGQSKLLWALALGVLVLNETPSTFRIIGTIVIFLGVSVLLFHPEKKFGRLADPGVQWTLCSAILTAGVAIADKFSVGYFRPEVYGFLVYAGPTLVLLLFLRTRTAHITHLFRHRPWTAFAGLVFDTLGYFFVLKIFAVADITFVYPLLQLGTLLTTIGGILILKEREHLLQKLIATAVIILGSALVKYE